MSRTGGSVERKFSARIWTCGWWWDQFCNCISLPKVKEIPCYLWRFCSTSAKGTRENVTFCISTHEACCQIRGRKVKDACKVFASSKEPVFVLLHNTLQAPFQQTHVKQQNNIVKAEVTLFIRCSWLDQKSDSFSFVRQAQSCKEAASRQHRTKISKTRLNISVSNPEVLCYLCVRLSASQVTVNAINSLETTKTISLELWIFGQLGRISSQRK